MEYVFTDTTFVLYSKHMEVRYKGLMNKFAGNRNDGIKYQDITKLKFQDSTFFNGGAGSFYLFSSQNREIKFYFGKKQRMMALEFKNFIDKKIAEHQVKSAESALEHFEELKKLKELYDLGIITEQQYKEKKKEYIS